MSATIAAIGSFLGAIITGPFFAPAGVMIGGGTAAILKELVVDKYP